MKKRNKVRHIWHVMAFVVVLAAAVAVVMFLWNALIPGIVGWSAINYWQAAGLMVLCKLLFGGFGQMRRWGMHPGHHHHRERFGSDERHAEFHRKIKDMSPGDKREYIREHMRKMHGYDRDIHEQGSGEE